MAKVSNYSRNRIEILHKQGLHPAEILKALKHEGLLVSFSSITRIIKKLRLTGSVANLPRSGRPQKLSTEAKTFVDQQMHRDDKTTSNTIKKKLERHGICAYCQLICDANKVKRLEFAQRVLESGDTFNNVIFSDECSISLQAYRRTCFRMANEPTKRKPKPKHPLKVHVWGGISRSGATKICIFDGIMDADLFCSILETTLVPFIMSEFTKKIEQCD